MYVSHDGSHDPSSCCTMISLRANDKQSLAKSANQQERHNGTVLLSSSCMCCSFCRNDNLLENSLFVFENCEVVEFGEVPRPKPRIVMSLWFGWFLCSKEARDLHSETAVVSSTNVSHAWHLSLATKALLEQRVNQRSTSRKRPN